MSTADDGDGDGDGGSSGSGGGNALMDCENYLECVKAATPGAQTAEIATYGPEGTCWDLQGVTAEECHAECRARLREMAPLFPDLTECRECNEDADCAGQGAAQYCFEDYTCTDMAPWASCALYRGGICDEFVGAWTRAEKEGFCSDVDRRSTDPCKTADLWGTCTGMETSDGLMYTTYYYCNFVAFVPSDCLSRGGVPTGTWTPAGPC